MKKSPLLRNQKGQAFILLALMVLVFLSFFTFVVNTGLLINARINLQNAADVAAFAGAATQARQLNLISFLNYEMRRQVKKFLFRYYVVGNFAQKSHRLMKPDENLRVWSPTESPNDDYGIPSVCLIFNNRDNFCQLKKLPKIDIPSANPLDSISVALEDQLKQLENVRQQNCRKIQVTNQLLTLLWLFNTEPKLEKVDNAISGESDQVLIKAFKAIKGLGSGLGLVPRLLFLKQRIETVSKYVNYQPNLGVKLSKVEELQNSAADPWEAERTIQAFLSAHLTLGNWNFPDGNIEMDELIPQSPDGEGSLLLKLKPIQTDFETYYTGFNKDFVNPQKPEDCEAFPQPIQVKELAVGFEKDPTILTYYAVKLKASVNLMFGKFGAVPLTAYSAAQPFGSRIGPSADLLTGGVEGALPFVRTAGQGAIPKFQGAGATCFGGKCNGVLNLPVLDAKDSGGWWRNKVLVGMFNHLTGQDSGQEFREIGSEELEDAYNFAMAPNPAEKGLYNIPSNVTSSEGDPSRDSTGDPFVEWFDPNGDGQRIGPYTRATFWAPLVSASASRTTSPSETIEQMLKNQTGLNENLRQQLVSQMANYLSQLQNLDTENTELGETEKTVVLLNALRRPASGDLIRPDADGIVVDYENDPTALFSSWNDVRDASDFKKRGRIGYSVKFVSFSQLLNPGIGGVFSDGKSALWTNTLDGEVAREVQSDLKNLRH